MKRTKAERTPPVEKYVLEAEDLNRVSEQVQRQQQTIADLLNRLGAAEQNLTSLQCKYDSLKTLSPSAFLGLDRGGRIRTFDGTAENIFRSDVVGRRFISFLHRNSIRPFQNCLLKSIGGQAPVVVDLTLSLRGTKAPVRVSALRSDASPDVCFLLSIVDRSELTSAETDLDQTLQQWSALVHGDPEIIMLVLPDGCISFANRPWQADRISDNVGRHLLSLIPDEERWKVSISLGRAFHFGGIESCEIRCNQGARDRWFGLRFNRIDSSWTDSSNARQQAILIIRDITEAKQAEAALRGLSARNEEIREDERGRIAREIHDELGQVLTVLKMDLAWFKAYSKGSDPAKQRVKQMDESIDTLIQSVRRIASELGPPMLRDLGLVPAIEWQLNQFRERAGIGCHLDVRQSDVELTTEAAIAVFRVVQEALTNIARHSGAGNIEFHLDVRGEELMICLTDDGKGITEEALRSPGSFGLVGMRERIHRLGGQFTIESPDSRGTRITVRVPTSA